MKPAIVIALYRPESGKEAEFEGLIRQHIPTLREFGLITDREATLCKSEDGTYLEIFEWVDGDNSSSEAHKHPAVAAIWEKMGAIGGFPSLADLPEAAKRFPHFTPVNLT